jgi:hypothetical protein
VLRKSYEKRECEKIVGNEQMEEQIDGELEKFVEGLVAENWS